MPRLTSPRSSEPARSPHTESRFHLVVLAFQRLTQLKAGARPRVPAEGHKLTHLAMLEVMADTVSWSLATKEAARATFTVAPHHRSIADRSRTAPHGGGS